jgi:predicted HD superfamily hydrolase involved in NAD metabolism
LNYDIEKYKSDVRKLLSDYRYVHSMNVGDSAKMLAEKYGADEEKAYVAGILHDIMKEMPKNEMLEYITCRTDLSAVELVSPKVWHQIASAFYVRENILDDEDIFNAIRYHTTARANMGLLEKIIYVADFISAERDYPDVEVMRQKAQINLDDAIIYALSFTINQLEQAGKPIHEDTLNAYKFFVMDR